MDFNKITKKQLVLAALIVPILLAVIWAIRCQITSNKEYTIQTPIKNCKLGYFYEGNILTIEYDFYREKHKGCKYLVFEKDSNGYYYPDRFRITPPLNKPFIVNTYIYNLDINDGFDVGNGKALWVQYFLNKAIKDGHVVCGVKHIKNGKDSLLNIEIDGKPYSDEIVDLALNNYAEVLDSVEKNIEKKIISYCNSAICNPDNDLFYASMLIGRIDRYLPSCLLYLICKKKDDSVFRKTLTEKGKTWYKKYMPKDKYGNLQSAIQQLTSSYHWVNQENYKELYKIYYEDDRQKTEDKEEEEYIEEKLGEEIEIAEKVLDRIDDEDVDTDSTYQKKIEKISEFVNFQGTPNPVTISLIEFWALRWKDGSAETIYSVLKNLNLE